MNTQDIKGNLSLFYKASRNLIIKSDKGNKRKLQTNAVKNLGTVFIKQHSQQLLTN